MLQFLRAEPKLPSFIVIRAADEVGSQMLNVAIGWYVYAATRNPMSLAYVGLAQFVPNVGMVLIAGHVADRFDRAKAIRISFLIQTVCVGIFGCWVAAKVPSVGPAYLLLFVMGSARALCYPSMAALLPNLVKSENFPRGVAISSSIVQICAIAGPAVGGLIYAVNGPAVFAVVACLYLFATVSTRRLSGAGRPADEQQSPISEKSVLAGMRYVRAHRLLLGLISLDLFAVLLGGVTALLPIYARDILMVGPIGLGWLRAAPGVGAAVIGLVLAHRTIDRNAGKRMLACVAGFGLATAVFAISKNMWLSLAALMAAGGFDMVSVVIRQTLLQTTTPDNMRGRVSAVSWVFIGASSELGEFESGATAALFGTVPAALIGGLGTLVVVALWTVIFPELRGTNELAAAETNDVGA